MGIAGAWQVDNGSLVLASEEVDADLGARGATGWRGLEELGFPSRDSAALRLYSLLPAGELTRVPEEARALDVASWRLPIQRLELPVARDATQLVFRAAAELTGDERTGFFYAFLGLVNAVAVADRMPLGDPESLPAAAARARPRSVAHQGRAGGAAQGA